MITLIITIAIILVLAPVVIDIISWLVLILIAPFTLLINKFLDN